MARRRFRRARRAKSYFAPKRSRRSRSSFGGFRRGRRSSGGGMKSTMKDLLGSAAAGAAMPFIDGFTAPILDPIVGKFAGGYTQPARRAITAWGVGKFMPSMRPYTNKVLSAEAYNVGQGFTSGQSSSNNSNNAIVYG